jgi:hypothetical protein
LLRRAARGSRRSGILAGQGNTTQFAADALHTVLTSDAHHPRWENARSYIKYYLRFSLSGRHFPPAGPPLRIVRYDPGAMSVTSVCAKAAKIAFRFQGDVPNVLRALSGTGYASKKSAEDVLLLPVCHWLWQHCHRLRLSSKK